MPIYVYSCTKCNLKLTLLRPMADRNNLKELKETYCKFNNSKAHNSECELKREQTNASFRI